MKFKSYSNIWKVEKMLYSLDTINLPFPVSFSQCAWFVLTLLAVIMFDDIPPLSFTDNVIIKYIAIPVFMAWFMNKKSFDGKYSSNVFIPSKDILCRQDGKTEKRKAGYKHYGSQE